MWTLISLLLTAAAAEPGSGPVQLPPRVQVSAQATAEIVRAETSTPETTAGQTRRHVRRRSDGQAAVEFE